LREVALLEQLGQVASHDEPQLVLGAQAFLVLQQLHAQC
jgi:hypothetical protein